VDEAHPCPSRQGIVASCRRSMGLHHAPQMVQASRPWGYGGW
jgi:hypothetical protein